MIILQTQNVRYVESVCLQSMEKTVNFWYVRTENVDIEKQFPVRRMQDPKCHKKMELYVKGKEDTFVCSCGYKEKLSSFTARRQKEGAGVSKKDVQRYLNKQKKEAEEPINSAFADAFAKLNL